jgi:hypothetical protein
VKILNKISETSFFLKKGFAITNLDVTFIAIRNSVYSSVDWFYEQLFSFVKNCRVEVI